MFPPSSSPYANLAWKILLAFGTGLAIAALL